jgi:uncharacterized membrane protein YccF (DUF307 family)
MSTNIDAEKIATIQTASGPGGLVQVLWFFFIGWWLGALTIVTGWILNITIIDLPLGMTILNNIPRILSLQSPKKEYEIIRSNGKIFISSTNLPQRNFLLRTFFFLLIGWWWSAIWLFIAYLFCLTVILIPVSLEMFRTTPFMTTLKRY